MPWPEPKPSSALTRALTKQVSFYVDHMLAEGGRHIPFRRGTSSFIGACAAACSFSRGARAETHAESLAAAFARGAPRVSTRTGF